MTALVKHEGAAIAPSNFTPEQIELIKNTFCKGLTNDEFQIFLYTCQRTGLDPFIKQIHAVKRKDKKLNREVMTIQTSIDGYRLIADRTGRYCPGREPSYQYDKNGHLLSATAYLKKQTMDGTWHEISAIAFFSEYAQGFKDFNTGVKNLTSFWQEMPHNQLAKCAEALAIRKAFPADLSGIYTKEEMEQAEVVDVTPPPPSSTLEYITSEQVSEMSQLILECDPEKQESMFSYVRSKCNGELAMLKKECYPKLRDLFISRREEYKAKLLEIKMDGEVEDE